VLHLTPLDLITVIIFGKEYKIVMLLIMTFSSLVTFSFKVQILSSVSCSQR